MCLTNVYLVKGEDQELVCSNVSRIFFENESLVAIDFLGRRTELDGSIHDIDLANNKITILACGESVKAF